MPVQFTSIVTHMPEGQFKRYLMIPRNPTLCRRTAVAIARRAGTLFGFRQAMPNRLAEDCRIKGPA